MATSSPSAMTPSLANRSFLYSSSNTSGSYATAPPQPPVALELKPQKPQVPPKPPYLITSLKNTRNVLRILEAPKPASIYEPAGTESVQNGVHDSEIERIYEYTEIRKDEDEEEKKKRGSRREYTKNLLNYVPKTSKRYYHKSRNLATKSLSLKNLNENKTLKTRSLSREELKYVTISPPSNFTHVASATRKLMTSGQGKKVTEHEPKYADLMRVEYAEIGPRKDNGAAEDEDQVELRKPMVNSSFLELWRRQSKVGAAMEKEEEPDYEHVGPPVVTEYNEEKISTATLTSSNSSSLGDDYDDVGPPVGPELYEHVYDDVVHKTDNKNNNTGIALQLFLVKDTLEDEHVYDDVQHKTVKNCQEEDKTKTEDEHVYDDVVHKTVSNGVNEQKIKIVEFGDEEPSKEAEEHDYYDVEFKTTSNLEEDKTTVTETINVEMKSAQEEGIYDHVGLPLRRPNTGKEDHERVNSLYVGTNLNVVDKESEWEDLEDPVYANIDTKPPIQPEPSTSSGVVHVKKKPSRWSRNKVRRQRSRASRKSSARSTSRSRTRVATTEVDVAVSLGTGSILLLGPSIDEDRRHHEIPPPDLRGLVQLRLVLQDDLQESSLYVAEDSSDDSNYETLETYEPDDFSSDDDSSNLSATRPQHLPGLISLDQAPYRAVPPAPPPTLGHTLGRHMTHAIRRTWSITKGSLHRHISRRRSDSTTAPTTPESPSGSSSTDLARKFYSFKKHFRKSHTNPSLSSTFYLDKDEPIYSNGDWYKEVGLYASLPIQTTTTSTTVKRMSEPPPPPPPAVVTAPVIDHYSVLAEEPLYQFYTAAATRVAFESDSDGYEEVEELSPSTATTELARPGHRTLWCQTPQVITRGLLQQLTMEERKIQEAKFEILTSEASYLNSLRVLENEFASNQELAHEILTSAEWEKLFGAVPNVLLASERFLAELETNWHEDPMLSKLPELLLKHGEKSSEVYVSYCSNQVSIDTTLKELKARKGFKFLETVSRIEMHPACHHLSLHSFLMLPMQRITRLPLLADAVLSKLSSDHPERLSWERVLATLSDIVGKCNEGARLAERRNEMDALVRKLEYPAKMEPVSLHDKELIRSGLVTQLSTKADTEYKLTFGKKFHKTPLMLMLLTDYLLVTKLKTNSNEETYSVLEACKRSYVALESAPEDSPFAGRHAMVLTLLENHAGRQVEYVLTCENDTEKERWLDAVSPPKPTCVGETLYESWDCPQVMALYSYPPRQPDELALQPGDVINVLRKMNDGWLYGEKLLDGEQGWFPGNFTKEVASEHVRARNLRQRHRLLALSGSVLQRKAKQSLSLL